MSPVLQREIFSFHLELYDKLKQEDAGGIEEWLRGVYAYSDNSGVEEFLLSKDIHSLALNGILNTNERGAMRVSMAILRNLFWDRK